MAKLFPSSEDFFINPYNFISQSVKVDRKDKKYSDIVSGIIACRIIVKDKLALPDHENVKDTNVKGIKYDFYKIDNVPTIPGSEIRGCVRNIFETVTGSCYSVINSDVLTKRVPASWNNIPEAGIVKYEDQKWIIYPGRKLAKGEAKTTSEKYRRTWKASPMIKNLDFLTQYYTVNGTKGIDCSDKMPGFSEIIEQYLKNNESDKTFKIHINNLKKAVENKEPFVAFYQYNGNKITYFSPAQLGGRTAYNTTVSDLLGDYASCTDASGCCPACSLFGKIGKEKSIASKLRFSDATPKNDIILDDYVMLPPLSSPKTSSVEFYSERGNKITNVDRWDYDSSGVTLKGRKYYLHSKAKIADKNVELVTGQFSTKTAPSRSEFKFNIYFDNISKKEQLGKLLWCLTLGENNKDSDLMQKIGAGKPVGYGSVKILVDKIQIRNFDAKNLSYCVTPIEYSSIVANEDEFDTEALKTLKIISNYNYATIENVSYPIADNKEGKKNSKAAHQWFAANRPTQPEIFKYTLPKISNAVTKLKLPAMYALNINNGNISLPQKGQNIKVKASSNAKPNNRGEGYVCWFKYGEYSGLAYGVSESIIKGTEFILTVNNVRETQIYGTYANKQK